MNDCMKITSICIIMLPIHIVRSSFHNDKSKVVIMIVLMIIIMMIIIILIIPFS